MQHCFSLDTQVRNAAVAFGRFDGLHLGHRAVIEKLSAYKNSVLVSFSESHDSVIYSETEKEYILNKLGIENMISLEAGIYEKMSCEELVRDVFVSELGAKTIVVGENCGMLQQLKSACETYSVTLDIVETVKYQDRVISSDLVKEYLTKDMNSALEIMGGKYVISGLVTHGKGAGRKHNMPTANLGFSKNKIWPLHGVYGTLVNLGNRRFKGVTNIGLRPSDDDNPVPTCETYILDFNEQIYDVMLILEAFVYLRPVMKFKNLDEVRVQIEKDIQETETAFNVIGTCN